MALTSEITKTICNFVSQKPRTVQEIASVINKNWRTTESYIIKIAQEQGTLAMRTFREGTRGALKIVYWNLLQKNQSTFQEALFQKIVNAKAKGEFSPFDIYQYVNEDKRTSFIEEQEGNINVKQDLIGTLLSATQQVLVFSGDLSWAQAKQGERPLREGFELLLAKGIPLKILARVDINSQKNVLDILSLNQKFGREWIEVRHCQQPLRAFVVDHSLLRLKEQYFLKDKDKEHFLFYSITDNDWIFWMQKVFWHFFSTSISAQKRLDDIKTVLQSNYSPTVNHKTKS